MSPIVEKKLMKLRLYQDEIFQGIRRSVGTGHRRPLAQLPTGGGKTVMSSHIVDEARKKHKRVVIIVPRRELVMQFSATLTAFKILHGVIMAGEPMNIMLPVQVCSADTLLARCVRNKRMPLPGADIVIIDEAHLFVTKERIKLIELFDHAVIIGLTATPARGDGRGLGMIFDDLVLGWSMKRLIDEGWLVPVRYFSPTIPDLEGVKISKATGDYQQKALGKRMSVPALLGDVVKHWKLLANGESTVVFCVDRAHGKAVANEFDRGGVQGVEYLDGDTEIDDRRQILRRMNSGESRILVNVFVATYGLDIPRLSVCQLVRPTRQLTTYLQMIGRVIRTCEEIGKEHATVIDHSGAVHKLGFVTDDIPWTLEGDMNEISAAAKKERGEPKEILCRGCSTVFKGRRDCPNCGWQAVAPGKPIPVHEAPLCEVKAAQEKQRLTTSQKEKALFLRELATYAHTSGYKPGWASYAYKDRFGSWPKRREFPTDVAGRSIRQKTMSWIQEYKARQAAKR